MREHGEDTGSGKWWAGAGVVGIMIVGAFIGATFYLGDRGGRGALGGPPGGLGPGPDPLWENGPGRTMVRRRGSPLWGIGGRLEEEQEREASRVKGPEDGGASMKEDRVVSQVKRTEDRVRTQEDWVPSPVNSTEGWVPSQVNSTEGWVPSQVKRTEDKVISQVKRTEDRILDQLKSADRKEEKLEIKEEIEGEDLIVNKEEIVFPTEPSASAHAEVSQSLEPAADDPSKGKEIDWEEILKSVNRSRSPQLPDTLHRLSELSSLDPSQLIKNTSSLLSFGLLAVDLFLLHNVQRIAFTEETANDLAEDPEVVALNSLFDGTESRRGRTRFGQGGVVGEVVSFFRGAVRGVMNLGRAYRRTTRGRSATQTPSDGAPSILDCIWTLYCRNLEKTAKIGGPYGFLARMNSVGLRLMLGEFPASEAFERLAKEATSGWGRLNCDTLFPRCGAEEARRVVMASASRGHKI